jgi:hypothetical protein
MLTTNLKTAFINKFVVVFAFGFRLPLIVAIAFRLIHFKDGVELTTNFTLAEDLYIVWTETQLNYALISATIPIARPFISSLSTNYGIGAATEYSLSASPANPRGTSNLNSHSNTFQLSTLRSNGKSKQSSRATASGNRGEEPSMPGQQRGTSRAYAYHVQEGGPPEQEYGSAKQSREGRDKDTDSQGSNDSQRLIIRKNVSWIVYRDEGPGPSRTGQDGGV